MNDAIINDTKFIYQRNLAGDIKKSNSMFPNNKRTACIIISNEQAEQMAAEGYDIKWTKPREGENTKNFVSKAFLNVELKYRNKFNEMIKYPPKVYLVIDNETPVLLSEETVGQLDDIRVKNVNVVIHPSIDEASNSLKPYIRIMYVEQNIDDDPFAQRYK